MFNNILSKPLLRLSVVILVNENILKVSPLLRNRRHFARWSARKPSKVFTPDDVTAGSLSSKEFYQSEYDSSKSANEKIHKYDKEVIDNELHGLTKEDLPKKLDYEVLGENDSKFSKLMTCVGNQKMRTKNDVIMVEGKRLNMDALQAGLEPKKIFFTLKSILEELNLPSDSEIPLYKIPYKTVKLWSKLVTPPGIIGFYSIPKEKDIVPVNPLPLKVICDNVRDPGNLGSIIRVAASVGCTEVLLMKGCTDPWDSKVLRSASGGHFHIPLQVDLTWNKQDLFNTADHIILADSHSVRSQCDLPLHSYYEVNVSESKSVVVIIGGETEGLSYEALKIAKQYGGSRLYIPLSNCMESLNSGCALSVILFEIKRQFLSSSSFENNKNEDLSHCVDSEVSLRSSN